ncbi:hypothetical protein ATK36_0245 [Amycolatopsis sulphurea]|uniref:Uncharacterized protein n=1 Tax=Amycolatopsis sulphurea TaxID=76022 RepID=A0A2A9FZ76_9PSEU|nr:hypothetical protein ATK36_0245 [Amycolatopsis sulphurea]
MPKKSSSCDCFSPGAVRQRFDRAGLRFNQGHKDGHLPRRQRIAFAECGYFLGGELAYVYGKNADRDTSKHTHPTE